MLIWVFVVNCIAPGAVANKYGDTIMPHAFGAERANGRYEPESKGWEASEIAGVALFLATDEASFVNATTIVVDGGWTAY